MNDDTKNNQSNDENDGLIFSRNIQESCEQCKHNPCVCDESITTPDDKAATETNPKSDDSVQGQKKPPKITWI